MNSCLVPTFQSISASKTFPKKTIKMKCVIFAVAISILGANLTHACEPTVTTVSGTHAPQNICSGDLIFEETFDSLNLSKWRHEVTMAGGGNWEFQWYVTDDINSYTKDGNLHLVPTLTSDTFSEKFLYSAHVVIPRNECTIDWHSGCERQGTRQEIINPIRSARVDTQDSFSFKYGSVEIRAKMPEGDWLWPALWMMPTDSVYGAWPISGEIDIMEMRGNRALYASGGHVGNQQCSSTIHFGPSASVKNQWPLAHFARNQLEPFSDTFHTYKFVWTPEGLTFSVDDIVTGKVNPENGFWYHGDFESSGLPNPWQNATLLAPFDQEFHLILNLAIGGTNFFDDSFVNFPLPKPW